MLDEVCSYKKVGSLIKMDCSLCSTGMLPPAPWEEQRLFGSKVSGLCNAKVRARVC